MGHWTWCNQGHFQVLPQSIAENNLGFRKKSYMLLPPASIGLLSFPSVHKELTTSRRLLTAVNGLEGDLGNSVTHIWTCPKAN
mmetsp:Transcript_18837/g.27233  ORF Transcript_18837/g.27233 Transcript_18837/m.27233 type:complete len:83 (+) Transcript_18837:97-345(+)